MRVSSRPSFNDVEFGHGANSHHSIYYIPCNNNILEGKFRYMEYGLGPHETELVFTLEKDGRTVFTVDDARDLLNASDQVLWKLLHRLTLKGRIQRIKRGFYVLVPAKAGYRPKWREQVHTLVDDLLEDYYLGYWTAMSHWHMTEQLPLTAFIATTSRRRNFVYDDTIPIHFITLKPRKFFGWTTEEAGSFRFRVSDPEKTVVDSMDLPQYAGGIAEAVKALSHDLDWSKVIEYADRQGNRTVHKRLGYLIELQGTDVSADALKQLRSRISSGYGWLDPTAPHKALRHDSRWNLKINLPPEALEGT